MQPERIVLDPPPLDQHLRFQQRVEDLTYQELVPQLAIERLDVSVLLHGPRFRCDHLRHIRRIHVVEGYLSSLAAFRTAFWYCGREREGPHHGEPGTVVSHLLWLFRGQLRMALPLGRRISLPPLSPGRS